MAQIIPDNKSGISGERLAVSRFGLFLVDVTFQDRFLALFIDSAGPADDADNFQ